MPDNSPARGSAPPTEEDVVTENSHVTYNNIVAKCRLADSTIHADSGKLVRRTPVLIIGNRPLRVDSSDDRSGGIVRQRGMPITKLKYVCPCIGKLVSMQNTEDNRDK